MTPSPPSQSIHLNGDFMKALSATIALNLQLPFVKGSHIRNFLANHCQICSKSHQHIDEHVCRISRKYLNKWQCTDLPTLPFLVGESRFERPPPGLPKTPVLRSTLPFWPNILKLHLLRSILVQKWCFFSHPPLRKSTFLSTKIFFQIRSTCFRFRASKFFAALATKCLKWELSWFILQLLRLSWYRAFYWKLL